MKASEKTISVLIPDGESEFALFAAHCLAPYRNVKLYVLSNEPWAPIRFSRHRQTFIYRPTEREGESAQESDARRLQMVQEIVAKYGIDVILPTETNWIAFAIRYRTILSDFAALAPLPNAESFALANDKWKLAQFLRENGIGCPPTVLFNGDQASWDQIKALEFPVLLKPISAWGGDGIKRFQDLASLESFMEGKDLRKFAGQFIVQTFLPGYVVGVNVLGREGRILATTMQRGIIKNTHAFAAAGGIHFIREERFLAITERLLDALHWSGFANLDTLYDSRDGELKILEINARFWGSLRGSLLAGVSFPYLACLAALNIPFPVPEYKLARYIHPQTALVQTVRALRAGGKTDFKFDETGWTFFLSDPLAEATRAFQQQFMSEPVVTV